MHVEISYENRRHCGHRKASENGMGIYLIGPANFEQCERLPFLLESCPCCGSGVKPARGYTWINPVSLFDPFAQPLCCEISGEVLVGLDHDHANCYLCNPVDSAGTRAGLIWVGEKFYKTAHDFMLEAATMGISRKIAALPHGFEVGKTVIYLAHRRSYQRFTAEGKLEWVQGVFTAFKPVRVDVVIDDPDDVPQRAIDLAEKLGDKGRLVKVIPVETGEEELSGEDW